MCLFSLFFIDSLIELLAQNRIKLYLNIIAILCAILKNKYENININFINQSSRITPVTLSITYLRPESLKQFIKI